MKKALLFILISVNCFIISSVFAQETITIATYYPAPLGVYQNLRLFPGGQPATCDEGNMYYNINTHQVMVCGQSSAGVLSWQGVGLWTRNGNDIYPDDPNWNVGIGTRTPRAKLDVVGGVKVGFAVACNAGTGGTLRYNNNTVEFCDGATGNWTSAGGNFGGCYSTYIIWRVRNPFTGRQSCPAGYRASQIVPWPLSAVLTIRYCYKR